MSNSLLELVDNAARRAYLDRGITLVRRLVDIPGLRVRLPGAVHADWPAAPVGDDLTAAPATHAAGMNQHGAVWVDIGGKHLGVKPGEFHFICPFLDGDTTLVRPSRSITAPAPKFGTSRWVVFACTPGLVMDARLEHLQDVTEHDAISEGGGLTRIHEAHAGMTGRGPLIDDLAYRWDLAAPAGSKWTDNPWTWRLELHLA